MADRVEVDAPGLSADGHRLAAIGKHITQSPIAPPGSETTSLGSAASLTAQQESLVLLLGYASLVREHGGAIVTSTAVMFVVADENNALQISKVTVDSGGMLSGSEPPAMPVLPPAPHQPPSTDIPDMLPFEALPGEVLSQQLNSGSGSGSPRDFSDEWLDNSRQVQADADDARAVAASIDAHWFDGEHNAATNVRTHGQWLDAADAWAERLSAAGEALAHAFDTAKADCPSPVQFKAAMDDCQYQAKLNSQTLGMNAEALANALKQYARLQAQAVKAVTAYHASATVAINNVGDPIAAPPLIAKDAVLPQELTRGPGEWTAERRGGGSERSRAYETQVTGTPDGMEYELPRPDSSLLADFDGYDPDAGPHGLLIEAKGPNQGWMVGPNGQFDPSFGLATSVPKQLALQYDAAEMAGGIPVEWRVAEPSVAAAVEQIIDANGYGDLISVVVVPPA